MTITTLKNIAAAQPIIARTPKPVAVETPVTAPQPKTRATGDHDALRAALKAVRDIKPGFDDARVAEIKAAVLSGAIRFDADKLAGLIMSMHARQG